MKRYCLVLLLLSLYALWLPPCEATVKVLALVTFHLPPTEAGTVPVSIEVVHIPSGKTQRHGLDLDGALLADLATLNAAIKTRIIQRAAARGLTITADEIGIQGGLQ